MFDGEAFGREIVGAVKAHISDTLAPIVARLDALERGLAAVPVVDLKPAEALAKSALDIAREQGIEIKAYFEAIKALDEFDRSIPALIAAEIAKIPVPLDGKSVDPADVKAMVDDAVATLPPAEPGKDADPELIAEMVAAEVAKLPAPTPGKDADPEVVKAMVAEAVAAATYRPTDEEIRGLFAAVEKDLAARDEQIIADQVELAVAALPRPLDGKSVTTDDVRPLIDEAVAMAVSAIPVPKDGADVVDLLIDRHGALVATLSNGQTKSLGPVVGTDADMTAIERSIAEKVAAIPKPKDGKDGFSLENFDAELMKDGRTVLLKFEQGERTFAVELGFPAMIYRGVYREEETYAKGDTVTFGGSLWHCDAETVKGAKPDAVGEQKSWTLCAKKGRDGRPDGKPAPVKVA